MITELTKSQIEKFPEYVEKWTKIGLCTEPANRKKAEKYIIQSYKIAGLTPPKKIVWCGSPLSQAIVRAIILDEKLLKNIFTSIVGENVGQSVRKKVAEIVSISVFENIKKSVGFGFWDPIMKCVCEGVGNNVWESVTKNVYPIVSNSVKDSVMKNVRDSVKQSVMESIKQDVAESVGHIVRNIVRNRVWDNVMKNVRDSVKQDVRYSVMKNVRDSIKQDVGESVMESVKQSVMDSIKQDVGESVEHIVKGSISGSVRDSVADSVEDRVWESVRESVMDSVRESVKESVFKNVMDKVFEIVKNSVLENVKDSVEDRVWNSVSNSVWDYVFESVGDSSYGQHDAGWLSFYDFFRNELGFYEQTEKLTGLSGIAKNAGWFLPHENICWVSERHCLLNRDEKGRLHSLTEPSVLYPDGWAIYSVHGVRVPQYVIKHPQEITIDKIEKEENVEIRRVMIDQYGKSRYLNDSGATLINKDSFGELYLKQILGDEPLVMVKVINSTAEPDGTFKEYFLRVPPHCYTAKEAIAWTFGFEKKEYKPEVET